MANNGGVTHERGTPGIVRSCGPLAVLLRIRPIIVRCLNAPLCAAELWTGRKSGSGKGVKLIHKHQSLASNFGSIIPKEGLFTVLVGSLNIQTIRTVLKKMLKYRKKMFILI